MSLIQVQEFLQRKIDDGIFSGASVLFGQGQEKLLHVQAGTLAMPTRAGQAAGTAAANPVTAETLFDIQSITKAIATAPLVLSLLSENVFKLDDRVAPYLPRLTAGEAPGPGLREITFRQLLTHTSGLSDADLDRDFTSTAELWAQMYQAKSHFAPGTAVEYCDLGYRLLGRALENIAGESLDKLVRERVWRPLGLNALTFNPHDRMSTAATPDAHGVIDDEQVRLMGGVSGCDGVFSNAEDLFAFMSSLLARPEVLARLNANVQRFPRALTTPTETLSYGPKTLGWEINDGGCGYSGPFQNSTCFEKAGGAGTFIWLDQKTGCSMVYLTNYGKPKPFTAEGWDCLVHALDPQGLSNYAKAAWMI